MSVARQMAALSLLWFALTPMGWVVLAPWVGWSLLIAATLYAVLTFAVCRSVRREQRDARRRQRGLRRLSEAVRSGDVVRLPSALRLAREYDAWTEDDPYTPLELERMLARVGSIATGPVRVVPSQWSIAGPFDPKEGA